jgi:hypothetical protein
MVLTVAMIPITMLNLLGALGPDYTLRCEQRVQVARPRDLPVLSVCMLRKAVL